MTQMHIEHAHTLGYATTMTLTAAQPIPDQHWTAQRHPTCLQTQTFVHLPFFEWGITNLWLRSFSEAVVAIRPLIIPTPTFFSAYCPLHSIQSHNKLSTPRF